jgi:hypothetical protein
MVYVVKSANLGYPKIELAQAAATSAGRSVPWKPGDIVQAVDPVYGSGEFIYLRGVASTVVGSLVMYDAYLGTTTLAPATGGNGPVAVAMSACNLNSLYGWYQIQGTAAVKAPNAMVAGADVFMLAATPGSVDDAVVAGEQVLNAKVTTTTGTPSAGLGLITINRPFLQGQIT